MNAQSRYAIAVLFTLLTAIACAGSATPPITQPPGDKPPEPITQAATPLPPTDAPSPTHTPNPFPNPILKIVGDPEVVYDWTTDRCEDFNVPDLAARAIRGADGQVQLMLSHFTNYRMMGPDLNTLTTDCNPVMRSDYNVDPAMYNDAQWIASPYTEDGQTIYALVHNEWRGLGRFGPCPTGTFDSCLDTSLTLAVSTDGGRTYTHAGEPPANLVATLPYAAQAGAGPFGLRSPSNIIKGPDDYYYAYANYLEYRGDSQSVCLMRTDDLSDPSSWRFWDGDGFNGQFINPYLEPVTDRDAHLCAPLDWDDIGASLDDSVVYNTVMGKYVLIGNSADWFTDHEVWGWYYSFSDDLIHWSHRKLLLEVPLPWTVNFGGSDLSYLYPSLIDSDSDTRNFSTTDQTAYLYVTRHNHGQGSLDRDLIRYPVQFFGSEGEYLRSQP